MKNKTFDGVRRVRETTVFDYKPIMRRLIEKRLDQSPDADPETISDKIVANLTGASERQIRKARLEGMSPYLADHLCVRGLGMHPKDVYGADWLTAEAFYAVELYEKEITPDEVPDLDECIASVWAEMEGMDLDEWESFCAEMADAV